MAPRSTQPRVTIQKRNVSSSCAKMDRSAALEINWEKNGNVRKLDVVWIQFQVWVGEEQSCEC